MKIHLKDKVFYAWRNDDKDVIQELCRQGWKYGGEIVEGGQEDYPQMIIDAIAENKIDLGPCLILADDGEAELLQGLSPHHLISQIPQAYKSLTKAYHQKMFNGESFFPTCFTLPDEKAALLNVIKNAPNSHWICKPDDGYGGQGMRIYRGTSPSFQRRINARRPKHKLVIQRYMENPYLLAGLYKFHFRCYMTITNVLPLRAYLYRNCQLQFATHPFDLTQIGDQPFNKYSHITNYKVNNEPKNMAFAKADKSGIGIGTEWSFETFAAHMKKENPSFSTDGFWEKLTKIARVVSQKLSQSENVTECFTKGDFTANHFEIYGLDILMDENFDLKMAECNCTPGLDDTKVDAYGTYREETVKANDITHGILNDSLSLVMCEKKPFFGTFIPLH